jgi:hypothetical protein
MKPKSGLNYLTTFAKIEGCWPLKEIHADWLAFLLKEIGEESCWLRAYCSTAHFTHTGKMLRANDFSQAYPQWQSVCVISLPEREYWERGVLICWPTTRFGGGHKKQQRAQVRFSHSHPCQIKSGLVYVCDYFFAELSKQRTKHFSWDRQSRRVKIQRVQFQHFIALQQQRRRRGGRGARERFSFWRRLHSAAAFFINTITKWHPRLHALLCIFHCRWRSFESLSL